MSSRFNVLLLSTRAAVLVVSVLISVVAQAEPIARLGSIHHPVYGQSGMVVTQHEIASKVGADILNQGGNAVDAAVAVGFSLAVVLPRAGNLGGGGFMMLHLAEENKTLAIDYREMAPSGAHRDMYLDGNGNVDKQKLYFSHASAGVPGTVAGLLHVQEKYGKLSRQQVLAPAITLAEAGFEVTYDLSRVLGRMTHVKNNSEASGVFFKKSGQPLAVGANLKQTDLAWSLKKISEEGRDAFYRGEIAQKIVADMQANKGYISLADLNNYRVVEREPINGFYRGYQVASMPPPSSGGIHLVQMLNVLEQFELSESGANQAETVHIMVEAMRQAYADRSLHLGDPDFTAIPTQELIDKDYATATVKRIQSSSQATPSEKISPATFTATESPNTTHYSIMDSDGNAVSNTYTLNFSFGSGVMVPGTGILLNNEMGDFSAKPYEPNAYGLIGGDANAVEGGKRPLSSMTPTLVFKDGKPWLAVGSPGGSRIITTVLQTVVNVIDHEMNIAAAVAEPRFHHQWLPDKVFVEPGFNGDTLELLEARGYSIEPTRTMGSSNSILWDGEWFQGAADPRKPDASAVRVK